MMIPQWNGKERDGDELMNIITMKDNNKTSTTTATATNERIRMKRDEMR
jgi:hypothetical protein